jgi:hypothetical protein
VHSPLEILAEKLKNCRADRKTSPAKAVTRKMLLFSAASEAALSLGYLRHD